MFPRKIQLRACFYIADFGSFGWGETRSKKSRRKVIQRISHVLSHDCFMKFRSEIVEIVGDSYDPNRPSLTIVAFKGTFENARKGSSTF